MRTIGFVVNPVAGMGGRVGLKGTDGKVEEARERGAEPRAPDRAWAALDALADYGDDVTLLTWGDPMGAEIAREAGFEPEVLGEPAADDGDTTAEDTRAAVRAFVDRGVDLILFVGGDGTAVDVVEALDERDADVPMLGVPAGVKIYSSVFGVSPRAAGQVAATFGDVERAEVNDVDEDEFRAGQVETELRGVATVPNADQRQSAKQLGGGSVEALAEAVAGDVREGVTYVLGPGGTVGAIKAALGFDGTTLGVDVWRDGEVVVADASESEILDALGEENVVVVSPIGGQGFVFGRGNQQLSPAVIRQSEVEVVASRRKLDTVGALRVDTGDPELDEELRGWLRVRVGAFERRLMEVL
ncbi:ATP-NAD kinase family protein [Halomicrobium salinisoli]|uniref:ATP-NAD kinase family protein n=1 Tax=Halomicrobium salinisoli TaxID=2878391 RepID=UPI001CF0C815|nr:ATP-NAD kinase family protein [Halomicrobium salinisoli]